MNIVSVVRNLSVLCGAFLMVMLPVRSQEQLLLFDFGGADEPTSPSAVHWNDMTDEIGSALYGVLDLVDVDGEELDFQLFVDIAFDSAPNDRGSGASANYPDSASSDSLVSAEGAASVYLITEGGGGEVTDTFTLTFYASDTSVQDNRETRYSVTGATSEIVDLNPSGNVDTRVSVVDMPMNELGEIGIDLTPGPHHTASNQMVYLGVLQIDSSAGWTALVDFGSATLPTAVVGGGPVMNWNNVTGGVADTDDGVLSNLVATDGTVSSMALEMVSRFNGTNGSGTTSSTEFPATATQDSWFANTEDFGVGPDITPVFKLTGLSPGTAYDISFYASRIGAGGDNRETLFSLSGATSEEATLNPSENIDETASVNGILPDASGEITIALTPGPNNNNGFHFIYLGVLQVEVPSEGLTYLFDFGGDPTTEFTVEESGESWNNVVESVGLSDEGTLERLVNSEGLRTEISMSMLSRFNGVNRNGTLESTRFPISATRDSLFGNTATFNELENVFPAFKLSGLNQENTYSFTFFGSRSASDNRETRYTVTGSNSESGDLNASSNVDGSVEVSGIIPTPSGEVTIDIGPGPNNDNGSQFTYLGVMSMSWEKAFIPRILVDAGGTNFSTGPSDDSNVWNNLLAAVGQTDTGVLPNLLAVNGTPMGIGIQMIARFNGVNEAGTQDPAPYPTSATRDSLFGNTEDWSGLSDVFPSFMLTGLDPAIPYDLTFFGSRSATDNRETSYTVTGLNESVVALNVASNIDQTVTAAGINPTAEGTITVAIGPGANNDNANHFTYLGVLQLDWVGGPPVSEDVMLSGVGAADGIFTFTLSGRVGETYTVQSTADFETWSDEQPVTLVGSSAEVEIPIAETHRIYRVIR